MANYLRQSQVFEKATSGHLLRPFRGDHALAFSSLYRRFDTGNLSQSGEGANGICIPCISVGRGLFLFRLGGWVQRSINLYKTGKLAPVLLTQGTVSSPDGKTRASGVTVLGVDSRFFDFTNARSGLPDLNKSGFWASPGLWNELKMDHGSRLILRVEEPSLFSRDAPLSGEQDSRFISWNRPLLGAIEPSALGNFSLRASMSEARTLFVPLDMLQEDMFVSFDPEKGRSDFCNLILADAEADSISQVEEAIRNCWNLGDAGLNLKKLTQPNLWNLRSRSVFLSDPLVEAAKEVDENLRGRTNLLGQCDKKANNP